ncbi:hypothetical protein A3K80_09275, partial [Candidatus Bathyarchaeota archaeon RBG_13_38_9]
MKLTDSVYLVGGSAYGISLAGDCNVYLIDCGRGESILIDTGGGNGAQHILNNIRTDGFNLQRIRLAILTHCHFDHIGGAMDIKQATKCKLLAHENDANSISTLDENSLIDMARERGLNFKAPVLDQIVKGCETMKISDIEIKLLHTPGHTPGCISVAIVERDKNKAVFTGDIASTTGRLGFINGPGFDLKQWKQSIKKLIDEKPDRTYPGHGTF